MKRILPEIPKTDCKTIDEVNSIKFYGVDTNFNERGFITSLGFKANVFTTFSPNQMTKGNGWDTEAPFKGTLRNYITSLIIRGFSVYEFDTFSELMNWVAEGK